MRPSKLHYSLSVKCAAFTVFPARVEWRPINSLVSIKCGGSDALLRPAIGSPSRRSSIITPSVHHLAIGPPSHHGSAILPTVSHLATDSARQRLPSRQAGPAATTTRRRPQNGENNSPAPERKGCCGKTSC